MWVLDSVQERFQSTSPGDYEGMFIEVCGDSETRKGLAQRKHQESLGWAALAHWEVGEKEVWGTDSGDSPGTSGQLPIALEFRSHVLLKK